MQITGLTTGKLIDYGLKDSLNMGGCMAPAACDTIYRNLCDFDRTPEDYDAIFTGDLGAVGQRILFDLLMEKGYDIQSIHQDCGLLIFDGETQDTHSGGSGLRLQCICSCRPHFAGACQRDLETGVICSHRGTALQNKL